MPAESNPLGPRTKDRRSGSDKRQRGQRVTVRLTDGEQVEVKEAANRAGLSLGSYARTKILTGPPPRSVRVPPVERQALAQLLAQIGRLSGNVNQIAKRANLGDGVDAAALRSALADFRALRDGILTALGRRA